MSYKQGFYVAVEPDGDNDAETTVVLSADNPVETKGTFAFSPPIPIPTAVGLSSGSAEPALQATTLWSAFALFTVVTVVVYRKRLQK